MTKQMLNDEQWKKIQAFLQELPTGESWISTEMSALCGGSDLGNTQRSTVAIAAQRIREME